MPFANLLKTAAGTCRYCGKRAGVITRDHPECGRTYNAGWHRMVNLAAQAATSRNFDENALRTALTDIAKNSYGDGATVERALEEGWRRGVQQAAADGTITREEESSLRGFRDRLALPSNTADQRAATQLDHASRARLLPQAQDAALTARDGDSKLARLSQAMREAGLGREEQRQLVREAWETAVDSTLYQRLLTLDEEEALQRYMSHFGLTPSDLDRRDLHRDLTNNSIIRGLTEGKLPPKQKIDFAVPFNLMKSETLAWVMKDVEYHETVTRREREGTSHGLSIRVARGVYYRPGTFRSRTVEWDEAIHADTGLLGFTTKHIYFAGRRKIFRVRYDRIVGFEYYGDGFGILRDAQTAKPQAFRTGDGWLAYNLAVNLAQM